MANALNALWLILVNLDDKNRRNRLLRTKSEPKRTLRIWERFTRFYNNFISLDKILILSALYYKSHEI